MKRGKQLERLGYPGVIGLGLLLFSLSFFLGNYLPARENLTRLERDYGRLQAELAQQEQQAKKKGGYSHGLPPFTQVPEVLRALDTLAGQHGVSISSTTYQLKEAGGQRRLEVILPIRATYPALRGYLHDALALEAPAVLLDITLQRPQATDPGLDAQVRLLFSFAGAP